MKEERPWHKHWPPGQPWSLDYPEVTVDIFLRSAAHKYPDRAGLIYEDVVYTYSDLWDKAQRFAAALADLGVGQGDVVAVHMPNCPQFAIAYYGILLSGAAYSPVNPLLSPRELEKQLKDCRAGVAVTFDIYAETMLNVRESAGLKHVVMTSAREAVSRKPDEKCTGEGLINFQSIMDRYPPTPPRVELNPRRDLAHLAYTGGTTGVSKGVMLTHGNVVANVINIHCWRVSGRPVVRDGIIYVEDRYQDPPGRPREFPVGDGEDILINVTPWFHAMGIISYLNCPVFGSFTEVLLPRFEPVSYLDAIEKYHATYVGGAPPIFLAMMNTPGLEKRNLESVRIIVSGAAPLPVELLRRMTAAFPNVIVMEGYGLTEVTMGCTYNASFRSGLRKIGTVGMPVYDTDMKIMDAETGEREMPMGQEGEICIKGPQCMQGYYNQPEETAAVLRDGWVYTGDIGVVDEDGYVRIVDRKKDLLLYKGYNVYPKELEELLFQHQAVANCAVIGVPDEVAGEFPKAFVVKRPDVAVSEQDLMDYVNNQVVFYKKIRELEFIAEIPVSPAGKVLKRQLRDQEKERRKI